MNYEADRIMECITTNELLLSNVTIQSSRYRVIGVLSTTPINDMTNEGMSRKTYCHGLDSSMLVQSTESGV